MVQFYMYFPTILHSNYALEFKVQKNALKLTHFSRGNINFITIIRLYIVRYPGCRFKTSHNLAPILSDFFKLPYIVQLYM